CCGGGGRDSWERFRLGRRNTPTSVQGGVMFRRLGLVLVVMGALAVVPVALGAYPSPYAAQGGQGVMGKDGSLRYVALKSGEDTTIRAVRTSDGSVAMSQAVAGSFGVPMLTS